MDKRSPAMQITRGSLEDISRPASSERTCSRVSSVSLSHVDSICPTTSLVVLTNDAADIQDQSSSKGNRSPPDQGQCHADVPDEEHGGFKLQKAIKEMRTLEEILAPMICKGKEVKRQRKELKLKVWRELLQNALKRHSEYADEAGNTQLFLSLEAASGPKEEADFVPVFGTQDPDQKSDGDSRHSEQSEKRPGSTIGSFEAGHEENGRERSQGGHCGASKAERKQQDFVKKNIELASGTGRRVHMTQAERERLAELLREMEEEEEDTARGADSELTSGMGRRVHMTQAERERLDELLREMEEEEEDTARGADSEEGMWAVSVPTGQGYTPEPSDLERLIDIDSRICLLLPAEEFLSVRSSYTNLSMSQGLGSEAGWELDGDPQPGEKVLQDIRERRGQERRLQEIQQQLEILGQGQEMTCETPRLTEEQLLSLLDKDLETEVTTPWDTNGDTDTPRLSDALLSELLQDAYTTSFSRLENGTCAE